MKIAGAVTSAITIPASAVTSVERIRAHAAANAITLRASASQKNRKNPVMKTTKINRSNYLEAI